MHTHARMGERAGTGTLADRSRGTHHVDGDGGRDNSSAPVDSPSQSDNHAAFCAEQHSRTRRASLQLRVAWPRLPRTAGGSVKALLLPEPALHTYSLHDGRSFRLLSPREQRLLVSETSRWRAPWLYEGHFPAIDASLWSGAGAPPASSRRGGNARSRRGGGDAPLVLGFIREPASWCVSYISFWWRHQQHSNAPRWTKLFVRARWYAVLRKGGLLKADLTEFVRVEAVRICPGLVVRWFCGHHADCLASATASATHAAASPRDVNASDITAAGTAETAHSPALRRALLEVEHAYAFVGVVEQLGRSLALLRVLLPGLLAVSAGNAGQAARTLGRKEARTLGRKDGAADRPFGLAWHGAHESTAAARPRLGGPKQRRNSNSLTPEAGARSRGQVGDGTFSALALGRRHDHSGGWRAELQPELLAAIRAAMVEDVLLYERVVALLAAREHCACDVINKCGDIASPRPLPANRQPSDDESDFETEAEG